MQRAASSSGDVMADFINNLIGGLFTLLGTVLSLIFGFLPDSPFSSLTIPAGAQTILGYANYFLPISEVVTTLEIWTAAIAVYYVYSIVLRFIKAID